MKAWPDFVRAAKARGIKEPSEIWSDFVRALYELHEAKEQAAVADALKGVAANAVTLTPAQLAICSAMQITPEAFAAIGTTSAAEASLTPAQRKMAAALGVSAEAFAAERGERRL